MPAPGPGEDGRVCDPPDLPAPSRPRPCAAQQPLSCAPWAATAWYGGGPAPCWLTPELLGGAGQGYSLAHHNRPHGTFLRQGAANELHGWRSGGCALERGPQPQAALSGATAGHKQLCVAARGRRGGGGPAEASTIHLRDPSSAIQGRQDIDSPLHKPPCWATGSTPPSGESPGPANHRASTVRTAGGPG